ncbi:MAG: hypothetical protein R2851_28215 [Caldilineaceae bacterium]
MVSPGRNDGSSLSTWWPDLPADLEEMPDALFGDEADLGVVLRETWVSRHSVVNVASRSGMSAAVLAELQPDAADSAVLSWLSTMSDKRVDDLAHCDEVQPGSAGQRTRSKGLR